MPGYEKMESLKMAVPGANFGGKRVGSNGLKAGLHGLFYLPASCLPSTADINARGVYTTTDM